MSAFSTASGSNPYMIKCSKKDDCALAPLPLLPSHRCWNHASVFERKRWVPYFIDALMSGVRIQDKRLHLAHFSPVYLTGVWGRLFTEQRATLNRIVLKGWEVSHCKFIDCDFKSLEFVDSRVQWVNVRNCNLQTLNLRSTTWQDSVFDRTSIANATVDEATNIKRTIFVATKIPDQLKGKLRKGECVEITDDLEKGHRAFIAFIHDLQLGNRIISLRRIYFSNTLKGLVLGALVFQYVNSVLGLSGRLLLVSTIGAGLGGGIACLKTLMGKSNILGASGLTEICIEQLNAISDQMNTLYAMRLKGFIPDRFYSKMSSKLIRDAFSVITSESIEKHLSSKEESYSKGDSAEKLKKKAAHDVESMAELASEAAKARQYVTKNREMLLSNYNGLYVAVWGDSVIFHASDYGQLEAKLGDRPAFIELICQDTLGSLEQSDHFWTGVEISDGLDSMQI